MRRCHAAAALVLVALLSTAARGGEPAMLTEEMARPYFTDGAAGRGAARFALEEWEPARRELASALAGARGAGAARLHLLVALCDTHLDRWGDAAAGFEAALPELPLLADYIRYQAARARYFAHDFDAAMAHAGKVAADSRWDAEARLLVGDLLRGRRRPADLAAHLEKYLADYPSGIRLAEVRFRLAEAYEELGRPAADSLALYRKVTVADPLSSWAEMAQRRVDAEALPREARARWTQLSAGEQIERGMALYDAMRNAESEAGFAAALAVPGLTDESRCVAAYYRANSVFKARDRKRAAPLFDDARAACTPTCRCGRPIRAGAPTR
jgi:hypothetical protein